MSYERYKQCPTLGAVSVLLEGDSTLLVLRSKPPNAGFWGFPGGHVEYGETAIEAALRELHEETGLIARGGEYLTNIDVILRENSGAITAHYMLAVVLCDYVSGVPVAGDDAAQADWVSREQIVSGALPLTPDVARVLDLALARRASRH